MIDDWTIRNSDLQGAVDVVDAMIGKVRECHAEGIADAEDLTLAMLLAIKDSGTPPDYVIGQQALMLAICLQRLAMT